MKHLQRFLELVQEYSDLMGRQQEIDVDLAKLLPVINASYHALSLTEQAKVENAISKVRWKNKEEGLKWSVLMALSARLDEWLTPPEVRSYLETVGYAFGKGGAHGLASITTTLKRMTPKQVEVGVVNGQTAYRIPKYNANSVNEELQRLARNARTATKK